MGAVPFCIGNLCFLPLHHFYVILIVFVLSNCMIPVVFLSLWFVCICLLSCIHFALLSTIGELEGFLEFHKCDVNLLVGDFNVDFSRGGSLTDLCARDLSFPDAIQFTYEQDDGLVIGTSWVDHVLCSIHNSNIVSHVTSLLLGSNLSDHHPIAFTLNVDCSLIDTTPHLLSSSPSLDWDKASKEDLDNYSKLVAQSLPPFPPDVAFCCSPNCLSHLSCIDRFADMLITCLLKCAASCIPSHMKSQHRGLMGWNDGPRKLRHETNFWYHVWLEAGCLKSGILFDIKAKKRYKYAARKVKRQQVYLLRDKLAKSYCRKNPRDFWLLVNKLTTPRNSRCAPVVDGVSDGNDIANLWASRLQGLLNIYTQFLFMAHFASSFKYFFIS